VFVGVGASQWGASGVGGVSVGCKMSTLWLECAHFAPFSGVLGGVGEVGGVGGHFCTTGTRSLGGSTGAECTHSVGSTFLECTPKKAHRECVLGVGGVLGGVGGVFGGSVVL
jgi:hypothetical protein